MVEKKLTQSLIMKAFSELDEELDQALFLVMGGGGAMLCCYGFPLATEDVDAFSKERNLPLLETAIAKVATKLKLPVDWLNPYFSTFVHILPKDYSKRLRLVFKGRFCEVWRLGPEEMLIMKCFAARDKDIPHANALLKCNDIDLGIVEDRINELVGKKIQGSLKARDFFDDLTNDL